MGDWAHIVLTKSLEDFRAEAVFHAGRPRGQGR